MPLDLLDEFRGLLDAFDAHAVDVTVVGALALAIHGAPRATTDIDLLVRPEDLDEALAAARTCGYRFPAVPMTFRPSGIRMQRVTKVQGGDTLILDLIVVDEVLEAAWAGRMKLTAMDRQLHVVSREGLLEMKALAGRLRDLADIERLEGRAEE